MHMLVGESCNWASCQEGNSEFDKLGKHDGNEEIKLPGIYYVYSKISRSSNTRVVNRQELAGE